MTGDMEGNDKIFRLSYEDQSRLNRALVGHTIPLRCVPVLGIKTACHIKVHEWRGIRILYSVVEAGLCQESDWSHSLGVSHRDADGVLYGCSEARGLPGLQEYIDSVPELKQIVDTV